MNKQRTIKEHIEGILKSSGFAVLATVGNGQPHTSLIAITPIEDFSQLIFATYRNTLKYQNLKQNDKVSVLIEGEHVNVNGLKECIVLTIVGHIQEISNEDREAYFNLHLKQHPELESFMLSANCALILIIAQLYQVVFGIDDIRWVTAENLNPN
jgi:nitroimidazol reductase NimA-like FMN-containing flavoprotein (pyridoxamine 5'-phosphate oxidase superfamily)